MSSAAIGDNDRQWNFYHNDKWPYDHFVRTYILKMMEYGFVKEHYDRALADFRYPPKALERCIGTLPLRPAGIDWFLAALDAVEETGIHTVFPLISAAATRKQTEVFIRVTGIPLATFLVFMDFFKQWWFPFGAQLRQLIEESDQAVLNHIAVLKTHGLSQGFALLDIGRKRDGRRQLAEQTGIPEAALLGLVHRADLTRIPYVSGGTVKRCWAVGYDSLMKLQKADPEVYYVSVSQYYASIRKPNPFDAKLDYIREFLSDARRFPRVVEE